MIIYVVEIPENCNRCMFIENMSRHWDVDDYCFLNKLSIGRFDKNNKCPLRVSEGENKTLKERK